MKSKFPLKVYKLKNGLTINHYFSDSDYVTAKYAVPVGSGHNTNDIIWGTFHFLEHIVLQRSKLFPEIFSWKKEVGKTGGYSNAFTSRSKTVFLASVPKKDQSLIDGLFSSIFDPIFDEESVIGERGIIKNERKSKERWFPGDNEIENYLFTEWIDEDKDYIYQRLGSDQDLDNINSEYLSKIHQTYYRNKNGVLFIGGDVDIEHIISILEKIETTDILPEFQERTFSWKNPDYREVSFTDANRYEYYIAGFYDKDWKKDLIGRFGIGLLINGIQGPLFEWLRNEKKWVYGLDYFSSSFYENSFWYLCVPLSQKENVEEVRKKLKERIKLAFSDKKIIESEKNRFLGKRLYQFETIEDVVNADVNTFCGYGFTISEEDILNTIKNITSEDLLSMLESYGGEILITPKNEK